MDDALSKVYEYLATYGLSVIAAVAIFVIGKWLARKITMLIERSMGRANVDKTLVSSGTPTTADTVTLA